MPTFQEEDYIKMLETLIKVAEANKGTALGEDDRLLDAEGLFMKFIGHAASALYLLKVRPCQVSRLQIEGSASLIRDR